MNIIADKITFGGKSLGKIDGKNVFVPFAIPGEKLEVEITEHKKDYDNAVIKSIIFPSPFRVKAPCPYYQNCGGCNMMHISPEHQRVLRKQILCDIFHQHSIDISSITQTIYGPDFNYRSRFQLNNGGLSQKSSNSIVPVTNCLCAEPVINEYFSKTNFEDRPKGRIHLFGSDYVCSEKKLSVTQEKQLNQDRLKGNKAKKIKLKEKHYFAGTVASPENTVTVRLAEKEFCFDVRGFFQSNLFVFEKVLKLISENLYGGKNALDMYCGCGAISSFIADKYETVVMVEHNRDALVYAEQNLRGHKHISYGMSGASWVKNCSAECTSLCGAFDACVIDPPRSGMENEVCDYLCNSKIPLILSMSCDPSTQARDCAKLIKAGYVLEKMYLLDFYPNTSHIESLAVLKL